MSDPLSLSLDLLRRLPPSSISSNLDTLVSLFPALADDLYSSVDQPLRIRIDKSTQGAGREYLACDYNRDGDSWRSPWSGEYDPPLQDGTQPSKGLRELEIRMGGAMESYRQLYYESGLSSVYLWDLDDGAFAGVVLFKKDIDPTTSSDPTKSGTIGLWDSLHVFEAIPDRGARSASYKLTSTVMLSLGRQEGSSTSSFSSSSSSTTTTAASSEAKVSLGTFSLSGSLTRQSSIDAPLLPPPSSSSSSGAGQGHYSPSHIANIGRLIEDAEGKMRAQIVEVYFGKTKDILGYVRSSEDLENKRREEGVRRELMGLWKK